VQRRTTRPLRQRHDKGQPHRELGSPSTPRSQSPAPSQRRRDVLEDQLIWLGQRQPAHPVAALGRPGSADWRVLALQVERYRRASGITSPICALGASPVAAYESGDWKRLADRIARYQHVPEVTFEDLCVIPATTARFQEQAALTMLEDRRGFGVLSAGELKKIIGTPTLVLRRHVSFAADLISKRPEDPSGRVSALSINRNDLVALHAAHQAILGEVAARLKSQSNRVTQATTAGDRRLEAAVHSHEAALVRLSAARQRLERDQERVGTAVGRRRRWDELHQLCLAIGLHSAYELVRRELKLLIALERQPPPYLERKLGPCRGRTKAGRPGEGAHG
jgi:hypothetical protein